MKVFFGKKDCVLALGAESEGVFAVYKDGNIFISRNFGDLPEEGNFLKYKKAVIDCLKKEKFKPDVILADLHPLFKTTALGEEMAKKYKAKHIKVQHHIAHIFSAVGDKIINSDCHSERSVSGVKNPSRMRDSAHSCLPDRQACEIPHYARNDKLLLSDLFYGLAMDGTGYGLDGNIWGGEVFKISNDKFQMTIRQLADQNLKSKKEIQKNNLYVERIGSLEEQIMIGGDMAVREPARMLIAILAKIINSKSPYFPPLQRGIKGDFPNKSQITNSKSQKDFIYKYIKKFYTRNEFEALYNQMEQNFNCQKTTSTGRILDAVSVLLGFARNERNYKHEATKKLEDNSSMPYNDLDLRFKIYDLRIILDTTHLFEYLVENIHKDKKRLAATSQLYIAKGLCEIIRLQTKGYRLKTSVFAAGGLSNNKIISEYLENQGVYLAKKIPRGDEGIAIGQIVYYLFNC